VSEADILMRKRGTIRSRQTDDQAKVPWVVEDSCPDCSAGGV
jgi:hypothetical protein